MISLDTSLGENKTTSETFEVGVYDGNFERTDAISVPDAIYNCPSRIDLIQMAYKYYRNKMRSPNRGIIAKEDMAYSTVKIARQKGRGEARRGGRKAAPLRGGQKAHGPNKSADYSIKVNKKVRRYALRSILGNRFRVGNVFVLEQSFFDNAGKTADVVRFIEKLKTSLVGNTKSKGPKLVFVSQQEKFSRLVSNIPEIRCLPHDHLNACNTLNTDIIVSDRDSLKLLFEKLTVL